MASGEWRLSYVGWRMARLFHFTGYYQYHGENGGIERLSSVAEMRIDAGPTRRWCVATRFSDDDNYVCPGCQALLAVPEKPWRGWLCCPKCGLPSLPPHRLDVSRSRRRCREREAQALQAKMPDEGGSSRGSAPSAPTSVSRVGKSNSWSSTRLIISTGLFVSAFLLLVAYLDRKPHNLAIFGGLTVIFFILNLRMLRQR